MINIIKPGEITEWHNLVTEAETQLGYQLDENIQSYLVLTLSHYTTDEALLKSIIAIDFLNNVNLTERSNADNLRQVGDRCLIISGLFPQHADKLNVTVSYFDDIGQQAYMTIADYFHIKYDPELFHKLSHEFNSLTAILTSMRGLPSFNLQAS